MRCLVAGILGLALTFAALGQDQSPTAAAAYQSLNKEYASWQQDYAKLARAARSDDERQKLYETKFTKEHPPFIRRFLELAEKHPKDAVALDSLSWVLVNVYGDKDSLKFRNQALALLVQNHLASANLESVFENLTTMPSLEAEQLLRAALEKSPHRIVQARACFTLARYFKYQAEVVRQMKQRPALVKNVEQYCGAETVKQLLASDPEKVVKEAEHFFARVADQYSLVKNGNTTLGETVKGELFELRHLSFGKVAPEIEGEDVAGQKFKLSDYRGKVVVLTFWGHW